MKSNESLASFSLKLMSIHFELIYTDKLKVLKRRNCWLSHYFCFLRKLYPRSFVKLRLNPWSHMDYFNDVLTTFLSLDRVTPHSHGASALTLLIYFDWSDVDVAELNCGSIIAHGRSLKLFNFKRQRRRQPIRSPYANSLAQTLANHVSRFRHSLFQVLTPTPRVNVP